ncbi:MAG: arylsulfatase, partial [Gammaproteobacteria bacterium]|nr:arylsulfatase [Gammaproteobacteria bacterium]
GPGNTQQGVLTDEFTFVTDLAPTILSLVGINDHEGSWNGETVEPIVGSKFADYLAGTTDQIHSPSEPIGYELGGSSVLFKGDYKIVINRFEQNETEWHLFNIKEDPGETTDLISEMPELFAEMLSDYELWEEANNVLPMPEGYNRGRAIFRGGFN